MMGPEDLVRFVSWLARGQRTSLGRVRFVKFLYLADLAHARGHGGTTLTGWPWRFLHFGPFCQEAAQAIDSAVEMGFVVASPYASRYDSEDRFAYRYEDDEDPAPGRSLSSEIAGFLRSMMKRFGDDTPELLDYVYFETEPMLAARPGDLLDFGTARAVTKDEPIEMLKLPVSKVRRGREMIRAMRERDANRQKPERPRSYVLDSIYEGALMAADGEPVWEISGVAEIEPGDPRKNG